MLNSTEIFQIKKYLWDKKVSSLFMDEITDHFIQEISALQFKGYSFQEAFLQTKAHWAEELKPVRPDILSFTKVPKIEVDSVKLRFNNILLRAICIAMIVGILQAFNEEFFNIVIWTLIALVIYLGYAFFSGKMRLTSYVQLSFHPILLKGFLIAIAIDFSGQYFSDYLMSEHDANLVKDLTRTFFMMFLFTIQLQLIYFHIHNKNILLR